MSIADTPAHILAADWLALATLPKRPPITDDDTAPNSDRLTRSTLRQSVRALPKGQRAIVLTAEVRP